MSGDVVEGQRAIFFDPRNGLAGGGRVAGDDDTFSLVGPRGVSVVVAVDVHMMVRLRHC